MSTPPPKTRKIHQNLIDDNIPPIVVHEPILESLLTQDVFDKFFEGVPTPRRVGLAPIYNKTGTLSTLILAVAQQVHTVQFHAKGKSAKAYANRQLLMDAVLCNADNVLVAFDFGKLATALYADVQLLVSNAIDVQSACGVAGDSPFAAIEFAAGEQVSIMKENIEHVFEPASADCDLKRSIAKFAQQAWVAQYLPTLKDAEDRFHAAKRVNTKDKESIVLELIVQLGRGEQRLELAQPNTVAHEYTGALNGTKNTAHLRGNRYQTKFQKSTEMRLTVYDPESKMHLVVKGETTSVSGRDAAIKTTISLEGRDVVSAVTEKANRTTTADQKKSLALLQALQGELNIFETPFLQYIFMPGEDHTWPDHFPDTTETPPIITTRPLNPSQEAAVEHMLSNTKDSRVTIIRGPPGTGKTTVIAAFVSSAVSAGSGGIWLMAQSNIAVKNIAEKLSDIGFTGWKILVSADFHLGWHEHIYGHLNKNIIRSDEFRRVHPSQLQDVKVILCTLSMLSNPNVTMFTKSIPINTMVVDEASQITLANYITPLQQFNSTITKLCMIGDDKQLPPYGSDQDENLKSIFEVEHLHPSILLLDTQYRMPPLIGDAISEFVYDGLLKSNPLHPVPYSMDSCWFVHVNDAIEKQVGTSWVNVLEQDAVLKIAAQLQADGKSYCIITPYDAQRNILEKRMREGGLHWQDKCFNVDSFQGNEKDYIVVSLVRTKGLGFLDDFRRTNVMLTRCKKGMYICSSWGFVMEKAANTLVGMMAAKWGDDPEKLWFTPESLVTVDPVS